jgi:hypothetical protein
LHALVLGNSLMAIWYQDRMQDLEVSHFLFLPMVQIMASLPAKYKGGHIDLVT